MNKFTLLPKRTVRFEPVPAADPDGDNGDEDEDDITLAVPENAGKKAGPLTPLAPPMTDKGCIYIGLTIILASGIPAMDHERAKCSEALLLYLEKSHEANRRGVAIDAAHPARDMFLLTVPRAGVVALKGSAADGTLVRLVNFWRMQLKIDRYLVAWQLAEQRPPDGKGLKALLLRRIVPCLPPTGEPPTVYTGVKIEEIYDVGDLNSFDATHGAAAAFRVGASAAAAAKARKD